MYIVEILYFFLGMREIRFTVDGNSFHGSCVATYRCQSRLRSSSRIPLQRLQLSRIGPVQGSGWKNQPNGQEI